ncbi:ABC transporter substrate-binding protein [Streptomyces sp. NPDC017993]|uniref:ABC transporter substrate-binding protein n=1 Tax=Streptomyces sp. NPDC017993 TaxID=3365027 RepID=UPI00378C26F9
MTDHDSLSGRAACRGRRCAALIAAGVLLPLPVLTGCSGDDSEASAAASQDIGRVARGQLKDGGTVRWAVDSMPGTLNAFQADADASTARIAGAVLPSLFTVDGRGRPQRNADYLQAADISAREPKQVVTYKINPKARWSDGRAIGAADFIAQWNALRGKDNAYWSARNAGYDRIDEVRKGANSREVKVTFGKPYADWRSLFTPLYPKSVMGRANSFNDTARKQLKVGAGPFRIKSQDTGSGRVTLVRNSRWWGERAKLDKLVLEALPRDKRSAALAAGTVDVAELDPVAARKVASARRAAAAAAHKGKDSGNAGPQAAGERSGERNDAKAAPENAALRGYTVRKALGSAYTQLALNGSTGPLTDERVRRAVARAIDRQALADTVLKPLGLPARPLGNHLRMAGQSGYADHSDALGGRDAGAATALLAEAGWKPGTGAEPDVSPQPAKQGDASAPAASAAEADDGRNSARLGGAPAEAHVGSTDLEADGRPAAAEAPLSSAGAVGSEVQQAALLRQSASFYKAEAAAQEESADGDTTSGAYTKAQRYRKRAAKALGAAEMIETGQRRHLPGSGAIAAARPMTAAQAREAEAVAKRDAAAASLAASDARDDQEPAGRAAGYEGHRSAAERAADTSDAKADPVAKQPADDRDPGRKAAKAPVLKKNGKPLTLRFVLPDGAGSEQLRTVGERIARMLGKIGVQTAIQRVADTSYFQDHIASGDYDMALYSWPGTAYPATDARPIYAKPKPAADGSLTVEQNYTRVGTDHIDQLFEQATSELDEGTSRSLVAQADARIWAAAGSIPLYQRPELVATRKSLANVGAFGLAAPRFQDIGYTKG